jgi:hypothetical protein
MNERIPILYDMRLKPEWIDFALEQYLKCPDEEAHRKVLREYLSTQVQGKEAAIKIASQLQRNVGHRSPFSQDCLESLYTKMCALSPEDRLGVRLQILTESTPFFADCVAALRKLHLLGVNGIGARQLEERVAAKYGERETVSRRVRYVLQTLALLGAVENREKKWFVINLPEL